jgi:hypothetical protein
MVFEIVDMQKLDSGIKKILELLTPQAVHSSGIIDIRFVQIFNIQYVTFLLPVFHFG